MNSNLDCDRIKFVASSESFFTPARKRAISSWAMNLSTVAVSSFLIADVFEKLTALLKSLVIISGLLFLVLGVSILPEEEK